MAYPYLDAPPPLAFAHQGGDADFPNTMAAFARAVGLGYRYLETDAQVTADGVLVLFHDDTLERLTGRGGTVGGLTWREVQQLRIGGREPIPRFAELLDAWPTARINVEPKTDAAVAPLAAAIQAADALDRVCVGSFHGRRIGRLRRRLGPGLCTSMGPLELLRLRAAAWGLLPPGWVPLAAGCAQIPPRHWGVPLADRSLIDTAHALGLQVHVWTVNDQPSMRRLLDLGVDGIMTDHPAALRAVLQQRAARR